MGEEEMDEREAGMRGRRVGDESSEGGEGDGEGE